MNGEIFYSLREAHIVIEQWRMEYNTRRPHSALGYWPPAPATIRATDCTRDFVMYTLSHPLVQKVGQVNNTLLLLTTGIGGLFIIRRNGNK